MGLILSDVPGLSPYLRAPSEGPISYPSGKRSLRYQAERAWGRSQVHPGTRKSHRNWKPPRRAAQSLSQVPALLYLISQTTNGVNRAMNTLSSEYRQEWGANSSQSRHRGSREESTPTSEQTLWVASVCDKKMDEDKHHSYHISKITTKLKGERERELRKQQCSKTQ